MSLNSLCAATPSDPLLPICFHYVRFEPWSCLTFSSHPSALSGIIRWYPSVGNFWIHEYPFVRLILIQGQIVYSYGCSLNTSSMSYFWSSLTLHLLPWAPRKAHLMNGAVQGVTDAMGTVNLLVCHQYRFNPYTITQFTLHLISYSITVHTCVCQRQTPAMYHTPAGTWREMKNGIACCAGGKLGDQSYYEESSLVANFHLLLNSNMTLLIHVSRSYVR